MQMPGYYVCILWRIPCLRITEERSCQTQLPMLSVLILQSKSCLRPINVEQALVGWFVVWAALVSIPPGHSERKIVIMINMVSYTRCGERLRARAVRTNAARKGMFGLRGVAPFCQRTTVLDGKMASLTLQRLPRHTGKRTCKRIVFPTCILEGEFVKSVFWCL